MIRPVYQTIIDQHRGDCERACVATILGMPIEDVPNFAAPEVRADLRLWMREWLRRQGYGLIETKRDLGPRDFTYSGLYRLAAIATVPSQAFEGGWHAIVIGWRDHPEYEGGLECYVVHDPNPGNAPYDDVSRKIKRLRWIVPHMLTAAQAGGA